MSEKELQALAETYERDAEILTEQIRKLKKELRKKHNLGDDFDYDTKRRLVILQDMLKETETCAEMLKHYYDKKEGRKYVKHCRNHGATDR